MGYPQSFFDSAAERTHLFHSWFKKSSRFLRPAYSSKGDFFTILDLLQHRNVPRRPKLSHLIMRILTSRFSLIAIESQLFDMHKDFSTMHCHATRHIQDLCLKHLLFVSKSRLSTSWMFSNISFCLETSQ